ncbi:hypothetical protein NECAME_16342 [Necator americanus]|uniref:Uncharacterized protein n=1 Tax=Necator americanus TaxID=51031 RepID=W2TWJ3_NECAM|nr:hypothetical protein NECAME_16342 [Necator americanus]ETN86440.1 hypothetical protein NECAME_16342 [Necator americanus]
MGALSRMARAQAQDNHDRGYGHDRRIRREPRSEEAATASLPAAHRARARSRPRNRTRLYESGALHRPGRRSRMAQCARKRTDRFPYAGRARRDRRPVVLAARRAIGRETMARTPRPGARRHLSGRRTENGRRHRAHARLRGDRLGVGHDRSRQPGVYARHATDAICRRCAWCLARSAPPGRTARATGVSGLALGAPHAQGNGAARHRRIDGGSRRGANAHGTRESADLAQYVRGGPVRARRGYRSGGAVARLPAADLRGAAPSRMENVGGTRSVPARVYAGGRGVKRRVGLRLCV